MYKWEKAYPVEVDLQKIILQSVTGGFIREAHILPSSKLPRLVVWDRRVFLHDFANVWKECSATIILDDIVPPKETVTMNVYDDKLADRLFAGVTAEMAVEDRLLKISPHVDHIGFGWDDTSLEIFFDPDTPADFELTEQQASIIWEMGFRVAWLNFTDGTEQKASPHLVQPRRSVLGGEPRWTMAAYDERKQHVARCVELARRPLLAQIAELTAATHSR